MPVEPLFSALRVGASSIVLRQAGAGHRRVLSWIDAAKCREYPGSTDDFFPDGRERRDREAIARVKRFCLGLDDGAGCPVIEACRAHGATFEREGIWGAVTPEERKGIRRRSKEPPQPRLSGPM